MSTLSFDEQIRQHIKAQTAIQSEQAIDWNNRLVWWRLKVEELLSHMKQWLSPLIADGTIRMHQDRIQISEEMLGSYELPHLIFTFGSVALRIKPVGSVIIGAFGRIDVEGPQGKAMLILVTDDDDAPPAQRREQAKWFIAYPEQRQKLFELDEGAFKQLVVDLMGVGD